MNDSSVYRPIREEIAFGRGSGWGGSMLTDEFAAFQRQWRAVIPADLVALLLDIGKVEWGQTHALVAHDHGAHVTASVETTAEHFGQEGPQHMHGLYVEGTETVVCHTGTSPNSPNVARALTAAWNRLVDEARLASAGRNPKGEDREDGLRAQHEHAVPAEEQADAQTPDPSNEPEHD